LGVAAVRQQDAAAATHLTELEAARLHGFVDGAEVRVQWFLDYSARVLGLDQSELGEAPRHDFVDGTDLQSTIGVLQRSHGKT
jgi:hypothetical protein